ncbi:proteasome activator, partial [Streptomyces sp. NPDC003857]
MEMPRNDRSSENAQKILVVGQDGLTLGGTGDDESREVPVTEMVEQPAKVMRIGSMIKQLLEEVRAAPLDEASRQRLKEIHASSVKELDSYQHTCRTGSSGGTTSVTPKRRRSHCPPSRC